MPAEIPGFYWDEEKRKYFRIQSDHEATPGVKYTPRAIKTEKVQETRDKQIEAHDAWLQSWNPIKRQRGLKSSNGHLVTRSQSSAAIPKSKLWAQGLQCQRTSFRINSAPILDLVVDAEARTLSWLNLGAYEPRGYSRPCLISQRIPGKQDRPPRQNLISTPLVSTMCQVAGGPVVAAAEACVLLWDTESDAATHVDLHYLRSSIGYSTRLTTCRAHPRDKPRIVFGGQNELVFLNLIDLVRAPSKTPSVRRNPAICGSQILDVAWLSDHVAISSHRDGRIVLTDSRAAGKSSEGSVIRLQAPSGVHSINGITEHHILAAGVMDNMQLFDLRLARKVPNVASELSQALIKYTDYHNKGYADLPVAINCELNVIAFGHSNGSIQLFDLWSDALVGTVKGDPANSVTRASALCFSTLGDDISPTLFVGRPGSIDEIAWSGSGGDFHELRAENNNERHSEIT